LGLNIKLHGKISESATSGMNRGTPYAAGSAIEAHDQKKSRTRRSRNCYTHCANESEEQSRHSNEWKIQGKHIKQTHRERKRVITWGDEGARRSGGEPLRGMQIRGGAAGAGIRRDSGGGVGSGARLRSPRGVPVSVACVACRAHLPSSQSQLRCRVGRGPAGLDWTGLPLPTAAHCPAAFPPSAPRLPFCSRAFFFPLESRLLPPAASLLLLLASASARPKRVGWWRVRGVGALAALRLARFGNAVLGSAAV